MGKPWPHDTGEKLREAGYSFIQWATCRHPECGASLQFWLTPRGAKMPMSAIKDDPTRLEPHWASCVGAKQFSKRKS